MHVTIIIIIIIIIIIHSYMPFIHRYNICGKRLYYEGYFVVICYSMLSKMNCTL